MDGLSKTGSSHGPMPRWAVQCVAIVGMAFFWKCFRSNGIAAAAGGDFAGDGLFSTRHIWSAYYYAAVGVCAVVAIRNGRLMERLLRFPAVLLIGTASSALLGWCAVMEGAVVLRWCAFAAYALVFVLLAVAWVQFFTGLGASWSQTVPFILAVSLLIDLMLFSANLVSRVLSDVLACGAPCISALALGVLGVRGPQLVEDVPGGTAPLNWKLPGASHGTPLLVALAVAVFLSTLSRDMVSPLIQVQSATMELLAKNLVTIAELTLVVSLRLFFPERGRLAYVGWSVLTVLFLMALLLCASAGNTAVGTIALYVVFTMPVCFEMYAFQLACDLNARNRAGTWVCAGLLIPVALGHLGGLLPHLCVFSYDALYIERHLPVIAFAIGLAMVICFFLVTCIAVFNAPARERAAVEDRLPGEASDDGAVAEESESARDRFLTELARRYVLTPREVQVFMYLQRGYTCERIADELGISRNTVQTHTQSIYRKFDIHTRQELIDLVEAVRLE